MADTSSSVRALNSRSRARFEKRLPFCRRTPSGLAAFSEVWQAVDQFGGIVPPGADVVRQRQVCVPVTRAHEAALNAPAKAEEARIRADHQALETQEFVLTQLGLAGLTRRAPADQVRCTGRTLWLRRPDCTRAWRPNPATHAPADNKMAAMMFGTFPECRSP